MLFNSYQFILFFPFVVSIYFLLPAKAKNYWLLAASYFFYMCWNATYALLLLFSTAITYCSGFLIDHFDKKDWSLEESEKAKKMCVFFSFFLNIGVLFFYKYFDFAAGNINRVLAQMNMGFSIPSLNLLLPVGISFYIFQALSYTMDVYRKEIYAEKNFFRYALFVSFFPQLVAGPIERSKNLLKQLAVPHKFDYDRMRQGLLIMLWGYFQKLVIADRVTILVDTVYGDIEKYQGGYLILASILFAVQIYCDFSGYSLIAIGSAKVMGFELMENFNCPYFARSVSEFWRRWHISLSSWFRDYLYIPLGGNRKGTTRKYINLMIVFLVSGLWHGAQWSFIVWGGLNGLFQVIGSLTKPLRKKIMKVCRFDADSLGHKALQTVTTFVLIDITWVFFRAEGFKHALSIFKSMLLVHNPWIFTTDKIYELGLNEKQIGLLLIAILILIIGDLLKYNKVDVIGLILKQDIWFRWVVYIVGIVFVMVFGVWGSGYDANAFVYFQF